MPNHGSNQAEDSKMQVQCPFKTPSLSSFSAFSCHPLSQRPYRTCRIGYTPPLRPKNTNAPLVTSRPGINQQVYLIGQKVNESMLWSPSGRLAELHHLKAQSANQTMGTLAQRDVCRGFRRARRQLRWRMYGDPFSTKMVALLSHRQR